MPNYNALFQEMAINYLRSIPEEALNSAIRRAHLQGISQKDIDEGLAYIKTLHQSAHDDKVQIQQKE